MSARCPVFIRERSSDIPAPIFRSLALSLGLVQGLGERWTAIGIFGAGVASDFSQRVSSADLLFTATGLLVFKASEAFSFGAGISYDRRTGTPTPLPALLLNWRLSENVRIRGFVPSRVDAEIRLKSWLETGFFAAFNGNRYELGEARYHEPNLQIAFSTATAGPTITFSANDWVHLDLYGAFAFYRRYDLYHGKQEDEGASIAPGFGSGVKLRIGPSMWEAPRAP